jgi:DNA-binding NarL/FixJ family response regulator
LHPTVVDAVLQRWRSSQVQQHDRAASPESVAGDRPEAAREHTRTALTGREFDILRGIAAGLTSRGIAGKLGIAEKTVEAHKSRLYAKLGARNQAHATKIATELGLIG